MKKHYETHPLPSEAEQEKAPSKLDHQRGHGKVLFDDISYLMTRIQGRSLSSIAEHFEVQEAIHELQHILADWDSYVGKEIAKLAVQHAINGLATQVRLHTGVR